MVKPKQKNKYHINHCYPTPTCRRGGLITGTGWWNLAKSSKGGRSFFGQTFIKVVCNKVKWMWNLSKNGIPPIPGTTALLEKIWFVRGKSYVSYLFALNFANITLGEVVLRMAKAA